MPLTREERAVIEELIKRSNELTTQVNDLTSELSKVIGILNKKELDGDMRDWTAEQWANLLQPIIEQIINGGSGSSFGGTGVKVNKHDHTSDAEGGDAFAAKGARLVE